MEYSDLVGDPLSPESTVTSLLSSSGHLRSSLLPPEHNATFRYRDKDYDSASAALDAYISDFETSYRSSRSPTGKLVVPHLASSRPSRPRVNSLRNRDVLRESLTERELAFLNLPVSSLHHRSNRDRLSMTTDELLSIPLDGSMPVTHTSAFLRGHLNQSAVSQPHCSCSDPGHRACTRFSSSCTTPQLHHHNHPHLIRTPRSSRCIGRPATCKTLDDVFSMSGFKPEHRPGGSEWSEPSFKADMDRSRMRTKPDLEYPSWIQQCDHSEPSPSESEQWDDRDVPAPAPPKTRAPSWVAELEDDDTSQTCSQVNSQQTLRDLRLQFAKQISLLATERTNSDIMDSLFKDRRIESLIQKADQVLNSLSQSCDRADSVSTVNTEELLPASPSRCPSLILDSAAAAGGSTEAVTDRAVQTLSCDLDENSVWKQPGPVEALKQMLFRLQAVETKLQQQQQQQGASEASTLTDRLKTEEAPLKQTTEGEAELENFSGGVSLHRALQYLSHLKLLVEEPRHKHGKEEEEKDEDEGRYSSSSADGLMCAEQKPSGS